MGRALLVIAAIAVLIVVAVLAKNWWDGYTLKRRLGRDVVMKDIYEARARENYLLLHRTVDLLQELIAADEVMPILNQRQKLEAKVLIKAFDQNQLPKAK